MIIKLEAGSSHGGTRVVCEQHHTCRLRKIVRQEILEPELVARAPGFSAMIRVVLKVEPVNCNGTKDSLATIRSDSLRSEGILDLSV